MSEQYDSYRQMLAAVQAFHYKHQFRERGGEDMNYRMVDGRIRVSGFRG